MLDIGCDVSIYSCYRKKPTVVKEAAPCSLRSYVTLILQLVDVRGFFLRERQIYYFLSFAGWSPTKLSTLVVRANITARHIILMIVYYLLLNDQNMGL